LKMIITELVMLLGYGVVEMLANRLLRQKKPARRLLWAWTIILLISSFWNLGFYWFAYPMIGWMLIGIGMVVRQLVANHQFLYQRFWPAFWRLSVFFWTVIFILSLFSWNLPVV
jgi:hypothetical protein